MCEFLEGNLNGISQFLRQKLNPEGVCAAFAGLCIARLSVSSLKSNSVCLSVTQIIMTLRDRKAQLSLVSRVVFCSYSRVPVTPLDA